MTRASANVDNFRDITGLHGCHVELVIHGQQKEVMPELFSITAQTTSKNGGRDGQLMKHLRQFHGVIVLLIIWNPRLRVRQLVMIGSAEESTVFEDAVPQRRCATGVAAHHRAHFRFLICHRDLSRRETHCCSGQNRYNPLLNLQTAKKQYHSTYRFPMGCRKHTRHN